MRAAVALALCLVGAGCSGGSDEPVGASAVPTGRIVVYATSYPLAYFADRIGGDAVEVLFPVPAGTDPAHWNPDADAIATAQRAELLLQHGAGDPAWLELATLHRERVVDTSAALRDRLLPREATRHQHGPEGAHSHGGGFAGTTWLDPILAAGQARAIAAALTARRPQHAELFRAELDALVGDLEQLDREQAAAGRGDTPLLFSHPVYAYLQARYGLNGRSVVWEPNAMPGETQWRELSALLKTHPAKVMFWEAAPQPAVAARLDSLGVKSVVYAPCAHRPKHGDWLSAMRANASVLATLPTSAP